MSRTTLCVLSAAALAALSLGVMIFRNQVLGADIQAPTGPGTWKVTLMVQGHSLGDAKLSTATPLDFGRQRILRESCRSAQLGERLPDPHQLDRAPERRLIHWTRRAAVPEADFRAYYDFCAATEEHRPTAEMTRLTKALRAPPQPGEYLDVQVPDSGGQERMFEAARRETAGRERPADQAEALFQFVDQGIASEPTVRRGPGLSAADCLLEGRGDARAKSRLLVALLRNRGISARIVTGLKLAQGTGQLAHYWVE